MPSISALRFSRALSNNNVRHSFQIIVRDNHLPLLPIVDRDAYFLLLRPRTFKGRLSLHTPLLQSCLLPS